jgi:hypothetical protein
MDNLNPDSMGRMETTAAKKLEFSVKDVPIAKLRSIYEELSACRLEFFHIRNVIFIAQPAFPGIPESELDPIPRVR